MHKELTENHRSDRQIQDYSNLLFEGTRPLVVNPQNCGNIVWAEATNEDWAKEIVGLLDSDKSSALLRFAKNNTRNGKQGADEGAELLTASGMEHIFIPLTPISNITTNTAWLYTAVASFVLLGTYSAYDFISDIPSESDAYKVGKIQRMLNTIKRNTEAHDLATFSKSVKLLAEYLGYETTEPHIGKLYETAINTKYAVALNPEKPLHCTLTLHSSKGLEFDQVILFIEDYAHLDNVTDEHINNHYVACTRAKTKLIIIDTNTRDAHAFRNKLRDLFQAANVQFKQLIG